MYPDFVAALQQETGMPFEFRRSGRVLIATSEQELQSYQTALPSERAAGVRVESWSAEQLRQAEPAVRPDVMGALFYPDHGLVDNRRLVVCLAIAAARRGVLIRTGKPVTGLLRQGDRVTGVDVCGERVAAGAVVNAAGCWAGLVDQGVRVPVMPAKGQALALEMHPPLCERIIAGAGGSLVARSDGRHLMGSTVEDVGYDKRVTAAGVGSLLSRATAFVPRLADATVVETWAGLRPVTADKIPLLGPSSLEGLTIATGHFTMGILSAPATAEAVTGLIVKGASPIPIEAFDPTRIMAGEA